MLLRNSKTRYLGKLADGRDRFALQSNLKAIQMSSDGQVWQDIQPLLVKQGNKWLSQGTPYLVEFDAQCARTIYPDRNDLSKSITLPTNVLFRNVNKTWEVNQVSARTANYDFYWTLDNTAIRFNIVFRQAPPFNQITLDVDSVGFNIAQLLLNSGGIGIPRPRLIDANLTERYLNWSFNAGKLSLSLDFSGLTFPVILRNTTIDVAPNATNWDGEEHASGGTPTYVYDSAFVRIYSNTDTTSTNYVHGYYGFPVTIPVGATIDVAYLQLKPEDGGGDDMNFVIYGEDTATPVNLQTSGDIDGRVRTTANVAWVANDIGTVYVNSPAITGIISELQSSYNYSAGGTMGIIAIANTNLNRTHYGREATGANPANLYIEYTEGGGGWANISKVNNVGQANIGNIMGVTKASIGKINGVAV